MKRDILLAVAAAACTKSAVPDASAKFVGTWTYRSGSAIAIDCPGAAPRTIDLAHAMGGQPGFFTFTASSGGVHEVDARGCAYDWTVADDVATAVSGQSCSTFPDGQGGDLSVHLASGTKTTSDGATIAVDVSFTTDTSCAIHVYGTATK
jgi:hypothetical protein